MKSIITYINGLNNAIVKNNFSIESQKNNVICITDEGKLIINNNAGN